MNEVTLSNSRAVQLNPFILRRGHISPKCMEIGLGGGGKVSKKPYLLIYKAQICIHTYIDAQCICDINISCKEKRLGRRGLS